MQFRQASSLALLTLIMSVLPACDTSNGRMTGRAQGSDPVVLDYPIAYVQRALPVGDDGGIAPDNVLDPAAFHPGAQLVFKQRAAALAAETIVTEGLFGSDADGDGTPGQTLYDVKDLSVSYDGKKLLFSMRAPDIEGADEADQPTWNIWRYHIDSKVLEQIIPSETIREYGHDLAPQYLPDDRILFTSNRQQRTRAILVDERKPQYSGLDDSRRTEAFNLHVLSEQGNEVTIEQITFNASHDLYPSLLDTGEIVYLRRDAMAGHDQLSLYKVNPDGTAPQLLYGYHSQATGTPHNNAPTEATFHKPRQLPDGRLLVLLRPRESRHLGGTIVAIDTDNYMDIRRRTDGTEAGSLAHEVLVRESVDTRNIAVSAGGYYHSIFPLNDGTNRLLASWSQCRLIDRDNRIIPCPRTIAQPENVIDAPPIFGLWVYDIDEGTQRPVKVPQEGVMFTDPVIFAEQAIPSTRPTGRDPALNELVSDELGVLHIRSVYDLDGTDTTPDGLAVMADPTRTPMDNARRARFIRLVKHVPIPGDDVRDVPNSAFGRSPFMRDILGYVPIEPDGSAKFLVPADVPFSLDILDADGGRTFRRHDIWLNIKAGESRECSGCHTPTSQMPHGRPDSPLTSINRGAIGGQPFPGTHLLQDDNDSPEPPEFEETMAEYRARVMGPREPTMDLMFNDDWTADTQMAGEDISLRYFDIAEALAPDSNCEPLDAAPPAWTRPDKCDASTGWTSKCRTTINYLAHIQPLWEADRRKCDETGEKTADNTCTGCHTRNGTEGPQVPAGQLELTGEISPDNTNFVTSWVELLFRDNRQILDGGAVVDEVRLVPTGEPARDDDGELVLVNGEPVLEMVEELIPLDRVPMTPAGSRAVFGGSDYFFRRFVSGTYIAEDEDRTVDHYDMLTKAELKLIAEWLDIGAQYYNDPFDVPQN